MEVRGNNEYASVTEDVIYHEVPDLETKQSFTNMHYSSEKSADHPYETLRPKQRHNGKRMRFWRVVTCLALVCTITSIGVITYLSFRLLKIHSRCNNFGNKEISRTNDSFQQNWYNGEIKPCPDSWVLNESSFACYYVSNTVKSWNDALKICGNMSSCLTNVLSVAEAKWMGSLTNSDTWVGGEQKGDHYAWICDMYNYNVTIGEDSLLWAPDEPRILNENQCLQLWESQGFSLDNHYCKVEKRFICKSFPKLERFL